MNGVTSKLCDLQSQYKNHHFLADLHTYEWKGDKSFTNWITQVEKIVHLSHCPQLQITGIKAKSIVYKK